MDSSTDHDSLRGAAVGIVGLGLMGGSLALGLAGKCRRRVGLDSDSEADRAALDMGAVEEVAKHLPDLVAKVDVLILAAPVCVILAVIKELSDLRPPKGRACVVMDIGSTKTEIVAAMEHLPGGFEPVGAHPICGREVNGMRNASAALYCNAPFVISPARRTTPRALGMARQVALALGARPLEMAASEHDSLVAGTSHLPYLAAVALAQTARRLPSAAALVGPGFRDTSRLAASNLEMMADILTTNRAHVLEALDEYRARLGALRDRLAEGDEGRLRVLLAEGRRARLEMIEPAPKDCA